MLKLIKLKRKNLPFEGKIYGPGIIESSSDEDPWLIVYTSTRVLIHELLHYLTYVLCRCKKPFVKKDHIGREILLSLLTKLVDWNDQIFNSNLMRHLKDGLKHLPRKEFDHMILLMYDIEDAVWARALVEYTDVYYPDDPVLSEVTFKLPLRLCRSDLLEKREMIDERYPGLLDWVFAHLAPGPEGSSTNSM